MAKVNALRIGCCVTKMDRFTDGVHLLLLLLVIIVCIVVTVTVFCCCSCCFVFVIYIFADLCIIKEYGWQTYL